MEIRIKEMIYISIIKMIDKISNVEKLKKIELKHKTKLHFIPMKYRIFGGLLQSLNIQFGNFIEELMTTFVKNDNRYEIIEKYSGKKNNRFFISKENNTLIDEYINNCQLSDNNDLVLEFTNLQKQIIENNLTCEKSFAFVNDIDLLFRDKSNNKIYYLEIKYNDDHDTGKFVDINRKLIKTYAYLTKEFNVKNQDEIIPILFYFTNKKLKGNIYIPENKNIKRGQKFFDEFLNISYKKVDNFLSNLSESEEIIKLFDELYLKIIKQIPNL